MKSFTYGIITLFSNTKTSFAGVSIISVTFPIILPSIITSLANPCGTDATDKQLEFSKSPHICLTLTSPLVSSSI